MRHFLVSVVLAAMVGCTATRMHTAKKAGAEKIADELVKLDTVATLNNATMRHVEVIGGKAPRLVLFDPVTAEYPRQGVWISDEQESDFPFTEMIPSWNVKTPEGTGVRFFVQTCDAKSGAWSPWLYVGFWGNPSPANEMTKFSGGKVDLDTLRLKHPARAWRIKAELESVHTNPKMNPSIRRISVSYTGRTDNRKILEKIYGPATQSTTRPATRWAGIDLPVPYRPQGDNPGATSGQTCSPTSVSMVLAYWGKNYPTNVNFEAIWDDEYHLFGNWNRAVARAGELGLDAWVTHFRSWWQVRQALENGQPIIASIKFKPGEFPSSVLKSTNGHLIVIRGMTANGDLICNDPGKRGVGNHAIYKASELGHAWFGHGGVAYIIHGEHAIKPNQATTAPSTRASEKK